MKKPAVKCPFCGSTNTREWSVGTAITSQAGRANGLHLFDDEFYAQLKQEFGDRADTDDYYCAVNICDDCHKNFATKNIIKAEVTNTITMTDFVAG